MIIKYDHILLIHAKYSYMFTNLPIVYIKAAHDECLASASTGPCVIELVVARTPDCRERYVRCDGLREKHVGTVVGTQTWWN